MICTASDLREWKGFPKGLRVLLLNEDSSSAAEIRSKLEGMDYIVSTFCNESEALFAISNSSESYHVAIVEVSTGNSHGRFKFLQTTRDLPTIMTSNMQCLSTMMKCIALGAVEFLLKPLSEDKLRNIWQHVVHKAFNAGKDDISKSLRPIKESVVSMLQLPLENGEPNNQTSEETEHMNSVHENDREQSPGSDKYPAPSTPQLKQGVRLLDDGDCQGQTNCSTEKESGEQDGESKSVETTCGNSDADTAIQASPTPKLGETVIKEEEESVDGSKSETNVSPRPRSKNCFNDFGSDAGNPIKATELQNSRGAKANRKKMKVDWTPELHKKFVQAVEQLGADQAIPSRILELMKIEGLTRHNVASHLQVFPPPSMLHKWDQYWKYRMHRRHILPKEDDRRWPYLRDPTQRNYYPHTPVMAYPPYHSNHTLPAGQVYPAWGSPSGYPAGAQMWWGTPCYPAWQPAESWHWKPNPEMHTDAWGCPVMPPAQGVCPPFTHNASGLQSVDAKHYSCSMPPNYFDLQPPEEVIDRVVKEAISKPWLPPPLGLKPPSTESVLTELSKQGISTTPNHINGSHPL